ncbi:MAG: acyltransferase family protein [Acidimicrobiia bacterium]
MTNSESRFAYKPALDGLRAVAVLAVIAYHLESYRPNGGAPRGLWASGGFLGVDTFFVLSGYLITSLLVAEWSGSGAISRSAFWVRRARRLLPALLVVVLAVCVYAAVAVPSDQLRNIRGDGLATLFYVQNWRLVLSGQSYFDLFKAASPLRHVWSLAIEEQFYILWPIIVLLCLRIGRGARRYLVAFCTVGVAVSVALMALLYDAADPSRVYYGTDTRAHLLLVGALLALVLERWSPRTSRSQGVLHVAGSLLGIGCVVAFVRVGDRDAFLYHGGFLLFALAMTVVIASAVAPGRSPVRRVLSWSPLRWIGCISYGLYLWHWVVIVVVTPRRTGLEGLPLEALQVALTFATAVVSYYLLELPVRRGTIVRGRAGLTVAPAALAVCAVAVLLSTSGAVAPATVYAAPAAAIVPKLPPATTSSTRPTLATESRDAAPGAIVPDPAVHRIALVGDSVADSLAPGLEHFLGPLGIDLVRGAVDGCPVANGFSLDDQGNPFAWSANCVKVVPDFQRRLVEQQRPDLVLWLSTWETAERRVNGRWLHFGSPEGDAALLQSMDETWTRLTARGAKVVVLVPAPRAPNDYGPAPRSGADQIDHLQDLLRQFARRHPDSVRLVELQPIVCPGGFPCPETVSGLRLRPDGGHFTAETAIWAAQRILPEVFKSGPAPMAGVTRRGPVSGPADDAASASS